MIFVFGSNLAGIHGAGAARFALLYHGAQMGTGSGRTGNAYAIPTKDHDVRTSLPIEVIQHEVEHFMAYARVHPEEGFQVTCIGCGLAGYKHEDIASMFKDAPAKNCFFDLAWRPYLGEGFEYWGTF